MKYLLFRQEKEDGEPATAEHFDSEFEATNWARSWLQSHAEHDRYVLKPEDDSRNLLMIRTVAGQWYAMPLADPVR